MEALLQEALLEEALAEVLAVALVVVRAEDRAVAEEAREAAAAEAGDDLINETLISNYKYK